MLIFSSVTSLKIRHMRRFFNFIFLIFNFSFLSAQQFGGNPPSLKWKQINSDTARIIFPAGLDSQAQRVASVVHHMQAKNPASIGNEIHKINIVLQNQTTIANGYVAPGPYRSEFFLTPVPDNFDLGSISWADALALHEYRHVMQYNNLRNGLSKAMYYFFGDDGYSLATAASVPDWFFEGDAVYNETILTGQGRGRLPRFLNAYPSLWQADKKYSWMKLRNGSFKDYVPNHYNLGYLLVNYGYEKYGMDFWKNVTHDASAFKGLFYPFQNAIKKYAGVGYKKFVEDAFEYYKTTGDRNDKVIATQQKINRSEEAGTTLRQAQGDNIFPINKKFVTNYRFGYRISDDSLLYLKSSYRELPAFYIKDGSGEHKLRTKDISIDEQFSYRNGKIVYAVYETDPRWGWLDYSVIRLLDVKTNEQKTLTRKSKYFTPDISPDGSKIAAVYLPADGQNALHILDAANGTVLKTIQSSEVMLYTDPKFIDNDSLVSAVRLIDGRICLAVVNIETGSTVRLTLPSYNVLGYPCVNGGIVYFTASYSQNDDVFALRLRDRRIFKITNGSLGNYFVNAFQGKITWSAFTAEGYQLMEMDEKNIRWEEVDSLLITNVYPEFPVGRAEEFQNNFINNVPQRNFAVKDYSKTTSLFHLHSWRPYYSDPEFSFTVYGENILNTLQTEFYYLYNQNDKTNAAGINAIYGGYYPYISLGSQMIFDQQTMIGNRIRQWRQLDSRIGLNVPLSFTSGRTFKQLNLGSSYVLRNEFNKGFYKDSLGTVSFSYLSHFISWSQQVQQSVQHIYPRFGYDILLRHRHAITKYEGYQFHSNASLYLPGAIPTHNLVLSGSFQQRDTLRQVIYSNPFPYSRGYVGRDFSRMWLASANYHFPLLLPDWGFENIFYIQRIRANAFFDFTKVYSRDKKVTADQRSVGGEIYFDTKWWNQYPVTFGFRASYLLDYDQYDGFKGTIFEFIVPVSIIPR